MPSRQFPGMNLLGGWNPGETEWGGAMNSNIRRLSAVVGSRVLSRQTPIPEPGVAGDIYLVPSSAFANANSVAVWDQDGTGTPAWVYFVPQIGWHFYVVDEAINVQWDGVDWVEFAGAGGGGGGGTGQSFMLPSNQLPALGGLAFSATANATKGMVYVAEARLAIHRIDFDVDVGGTYKAVLALVSGSTNTISNIIHESTEVTPSAPGRISFGINEGVTINTGARFAALLVRTDGLGTDPAEVGAAATPGPETPHVSVAGLVEAATNAPAVAGDLGAEASGSVAAVALVYTLEADGGSHLPVRDVFVVQPVLDMTNMTSTTASTTAFAIKSSTYTFTETLRINQLWVYINFTTGNLYQFFVGRLDGSGNLTEIFNLTDVVAPAASGEFLAFDGSLQVSPGDRIVVGAIRVDGGTTLAARTTFTAVTEIPGWSFLFGSRETRNTLTANDNFAQFDTVNGVRIRALYTRSGMLSSLLYDRLLLEQPLFTDNILNLTSADFRGNKVLAVDEAVPVAVNIPFGLVSIQPLTFVQLGEGAVFFTAADGVTILAPDNSDHIRTRYSMATLMPVGSNTYVLGGDVA